MHQGYPPGISTAKSLSKWVKACDNIVLGRDGALILPETVRLPEAWGDPGECSLRVKEVIHSRNIFCVIQRTVVATASS